MEGQPPRAAVGECSCDCEVVGFVSSTAGFAGFNIGPLVIEITSQDRFPACLASGLMGEGFRVDFFFWLVRVNLYQMNAIRLKSGVIF